MKKIIITSILAAFVILCSTAFITLSSTGIAGYAGSPGEGTCNNCHAGGTSASSGITITSEPSFSVNGNAQNEYIPDSIYQITIEVAADGFNRFGFASQILNAGNANAGSLSDAGAGVKFLNGFNGRRSAVHTVSNVSATSATFTYKWKAPSGGAATIYAIGNAVNGNGNTGGDFVVAPVSLALVAAPTPTVPVDTNSTVGIENNGVKYLSQMSVYPNPARELTTVSYYLKYPMRVTIELVDIKGVPVKLLYEQQAEPGQQAHFLNLSGVASGIYFIRISSDAGKIRQKLITIL